MVGRVATEFAALERYVKLLLDRMIGYDESSTTAMNAANAMR